MRKLLLLGAAALAIGGFALVGPANAGGPGLVFDFCNKGPDGPFQLQCGTNSFVNADDSDQAIKQRQHSSIKKNSHVIGLLQFAKGSNVKYSGRGGEQGIRQSQDAKLRGTTTFNFFGSTQNQDALNLNVHGDNDQYIKQSQKLDARDTLLIGNKQNQSATNIAGWGSGNYQEINQRQSSEIDGTSSYSPPPSSCGSELTIAYSCDK